MDIDVTHFARQGQRIKIRRMHFMPEVRAGVPNWSVAVGGRL